MRSAVIRLPGGSRATFNGRWSHDDQATAGQLNELWSVDALREARPMGDPSYFNFDEAFEFCVRQAARMMRASIERLDPPEPPEPGAVQ